MYVFFKQLKTLHPLKSIVKTDLVERSIIEFLIRASPQPFKPLNPIEQYSVDDTVSIVINDRNGVYEYIVIEPHPDTSVLKTVSKTYLYNPYCRDISCVEETINKIGRSIYKDVFRKQPHIVYYFYRKLSSGYGALYPLILDPDVEEIAGSSGDKYIMVIHRRYGWYGWMKTNILVHSEDMDRLVLSLARRMGKHISIAQPVVEGLTNEGLRVSLTYGREVSMKGSSLVIRKKPRTPVTIIKLIDNKTLSSLMASYLWLILEFKGSIIIVGGVSSGKTTLLQALLTLIPPTHRVVSIEDTPEITGSTGIWDPLVERVVSIGDSTSIDMYQLLKFSLRRRADYLVVGEVRGVEARLLIQASRLGHGVLTTMHAESAKAVVERLISPPISIPRKMLSNIWCIVVMENDRGVRRVKAIYELTESLEFKLLFKHDKEAFKPDNPREVVDRTERLKNILDHETLLNELIDRTVFLEKLCSKGVFNIVDLSEELINYYYTPVEKEVYQLNVSKQ